MRRPRVSLIALAVLLVLTSCSGDGQDDAATPTTTTTAATADRATTTLASSTTQPAPPTSQPAAPPATGVIDGSLRTPDGRDRTYRLFVPDNLPAGQQVPLLVAMHGGTGWGGIYAAISGYDDIATSERFIVVYPDGVGTGADGTAFRTWNAGNCCGPARNQGVDDVAFIHQLVDHIDERYPIDDRQIYGVGHSNGGMLSYRIVCEDPGRFAALAQQAGSLGIDSCGPQRAVSLLHLHGTADLHVPIEGGVGPESLAGVDFRSTETSIAMVAEALDCGAAATTGSPSNPDVTISTRSCASSTEVVLMSVEGASHSWMGRPSPRGESYEHLDASIVAWEFLAAHPRR